METINQDPKGRNENERLNYTSVPSEKDSVKEPLDKKSELQNTDSEEEVDDVSGDLAGNASGNQDGEDA